MIHENDAWVEPLRAAFAEQQLPFEEWHLDLHADGATRDEAVARLHGLLLRAARFEVFRRRGSIP